MTIRVEDVDVKVLYEQNRILCSLVEDAAHLVEGQHFAALRDGPEYTVSWTQDWLDQAKKLGCIQDNMNSKEFWEG